MKHTLTLSSALSILALVSVANSADTTKTLAKINTTATKVVDTAKVKTVKAVDTATVKVAKALDTSKVKVAKAVDTAKAMVHKATKAKKTAAMADTTKMAGGKSTVTGGKTCDEVKSKIEENIKAKGVVNPILTVTPAADVKDGKVVGSCGGGSKKIVYTKG